MGDRLADRIWVYAKQDRWCGEFWHQADKAEWITKSDGRPKGVMCTFPGGWTTKVALSNVYSDTRKIIRKVPIKVAPRMFEQGCDEEWESKFIEDLVRMGDNSDNHPPAAPYDDDDFTMES
jgi:hypothetical protein